MNDKQELDGMLALAQGVREQRWPHTMDAQVWADEWMKTLSTNPNIASDRECMIGWFSNSIMAGYDTATMRKSDTLSEATREELKVIADKYARECAISLDYDAGICSLGDQKLISSSIKEAILESTKDLSATIETQKKEIEVLDSRMKYLARHIWDTRYMSDMPSNEEDYDRLIGIAAEINSGNFTAIDSAISKQK